MKRTFVSLAIFTWSSLVFAAIIGWMSEINEEELTDIGGRLFMFPLLYSVSFVLGLILLLKSAEELKYLKSTKILITALFYVPTIIAVTFLTHASVTDLIKEGSILGGFDGLIKDTLIIVGVPTLVSSLFTYLFFLSFAYGWTGKKKKMFAICYSIGSLILILGVLFVVGLFTFLRPW
jgi:hypothetical protein